jgi:hypothetical protein
MTFFLNNPGSDTIPNRPLPPPRGGGGGGVPGGSQGIARPVIFGENGGFAATQYFLLVPAQQSSGGPSYVGVFSLSNVNDLIDGSSYSYRMEDVQVGRYPVVRRIFIVYRDLGRATFTVTVSATNDNAQVVTAAKQLQVGNIAPTDTLMSVFFDLVLAGYRPQVSISRAAGAGPLSIVSVTMIGEVEEVAL